MADFKLNPEAEEIARVLIETVEEHAHLKEAKIAYLFRSGEWSSNKRETLGSAQKVSGPMGYLTKLDFIIMIHQDVWPQLTEQQRVAMVDHELCHCKRIEGKWCIVGHDVEEHYSVVQRHGLWHPNLEQMRESMYEGEQLQLKYETAGVVAAINGRLNTAESAVENEVPVYEAHTLIEAAERFKQAGE
jgi:hypothetical protein